MMSQVQSTTVVNAGRCISVQDKISGAKQMETDPSRIFSRSLQWEVESDDTLANVPCPLSVHVV